MIINKKILMLKNKGFIFTFRRNIIYIKITLMVIRHNRQERAKWKKKESLCIL